MSSIEATRLFLDALRGGTTAIQKTTTVQKDGQILLGLSKLNSIPSVSTPRVMYAVGMNATTIMEIPPMVGGVSTLSIW